MPYSTRVSLMACLWGAFAYACDNGGVDFTRVALLVILAMLTVSSNDEN